MKRMMRVAAACVCGCLAAAGCRPTGTAQPEPGAAAAAPVGKVLELTDATFEQTVAQGVVLVDFWAPWCGPCRTQGPLVDQAAGQLGETAKVAKVNVDQAGQTAQKYGIRSIPTLIVFKDGKPGKQFVGVTQPDALVAAVKAALGGK